MAILTFSQIEQTRRDLAMARRTLGEIHDGLNPRQEEFADVLVDISNVRLLAAKAIGDIDATAKLRGEA